MDLTHLGLRYVHDCHWNCLVPDKFDMLHVYNYIYIYTYLYIYIYTYNIQSLWLLKHCRFPLKKMMTQSLDLAPDSFGRHLWYPSWAGLRPPGRGVGKIFDLQFSMVHYLSTTIRVFHYLVVFHSFVSFQYLFANEFEYVQIKAVF